MKEKTVNSLLLLIAAFTPTFAIGGEKNDAVAKNLAALDVRVFPKGSDAAKALIQSVKDAVYKQRDAVNHSETKAWEAIKTKKEWEAFRDKRIAALKESLGVFPEPPKNVPVKTTGSNTGDGFVVENIIYESRPGVWVTANLYRPTKLSKSMPGMLIIHSHHNPKTQRELQDMGMTWARVGCYVLVIDQLGHGERRQHPFKDAKSFPKSFRTSRQDYHFRYNTAIQLHLIGDSLIGWMAWDMMRGVDVLLSKPGIDSKRIALLGSVAGGGDPAAVTAAVDPRITAVVPFNFGGPQPESRFPLPKDAKIVFNYAGGGGWESTRNLRLSCDGRFLPWTIVGSVAPRGLIYAHEFSWDNERDPVWHRLVKIFNFYGARDKLASAHGEGRVTGSGPGNTHCNNIGKYHRQFIHPIFHSWFALPEPIKEYSNPLPSSKLICLTDKVAKEIKVRPMVEVAAQIANERVATVRKQLAKFSPKQKQMKLQQYWSSVLRMRTVDEAVKSKQITRESKGTFVAEKLIVSSPSNNGVAQPPVPVLLLTPSDGRSTHAVVVAVCQSGKETLLDQQRDAIAALLKNGIAVCLPDLRASGESQIPGDSRTRRSYTTGYSSTQLMIGETTVGTRVEELQRVLAFLRGRKDIDSKRMALWGESFAKVNGPDERVIVPLELTQPPHAEPMGAMVVLLTALFEPDVKAVAAHGGLAGFASVLQSQGVLIPHDAVVPGALTAGDLSDVAAAIAPTPLRLAKMVDGVNRLVSMKDANRLYAPASEAYKSQNAGERFVISEQPAAGNELVAWFARNLK